MAHNPYHAPSYVASREDQTGSQDQQALTQRAVRFVAAVRLPAICLIVLGCYSALVSACLLLNSSQSFESGETVALICLPAFLLLWGVLQLRVSLVAVTFTGVAAIATILYFAIVVVVLLQADLHMGQLLGVSISLLLLSALLVVPILSAIEIWSWRRRGLDPGAIARNHEQAKRQALLSQGGSGATQRHLAD